ncbi:MAG: hypothetical protein JSU87_08165 [Gemmatimonadota bacterium]|nr:MAG: hypothetical protein JSU87_08165 [Gemmatimonadota bacterium]
MKSMRRLLGQFLVIAVGGMAGLALLPAVGLAQEASNEARILDENEVGHSIRDMAAKNSRFRLFGQGDRAVTSLKATGTTAYGRGMEHFVTNTGIVDAADLNMDGQPDVSTSQGRVGQWFDVSPSYAAGREEWARFVTQVPSLANARGGGYATSRNFPTLGVRELLAADLEFGTAFSGVQSTADGGCRDQTSDALSNIAAGLTLLAGSDCPPTWPLVAGDSTFLGRHPISLENYQESQLALGGEFNFDWWRVDPGIIDQSKFFGNFQTYGAYDDFNSSMIGRFGDVVPGGAGDPDDEGWPLGLRTEFDAFTFAVPTVANSMFWRATIINETEKVYGVGLDYQKLHVGYSFMPIRSQDASFYFEVWRGAILSSERGTGNPQCPGVAPPGVAGIACATDPTGFARGITAQIVLKSPIGDLRNVLFTCSPAENAQRAANRAIPCPTDAFNDAGNLHAGDTITYNHFTMCPFGGVCGSETLLGPDRQLFGAYTSNTEHILNGRDVGTLSAGQQYDMFRNPNFPQQPTPHAFWVPGTWDYTANGETVGGDTIYVPTCYGPPGVVIQGTTREDRADACVVTWSDTMPVGELGNPAYNNSEGNVSYWSVGPFALAAGDTTALVIASIAQGDSAAFETEVNNVIDLYMNFYLSPEAPPKVNIVGVQVDVEDPSLGNGRGEVNLYWDDSAEDFIDPFLEKFADNLAAATAGDLLRLKTLNPDLENRIRQRARDNLERILIYKSCDNGATFTRNDVDGRGVLDCDADPAQDVSGGAVGSGWQAYSILPTDDEGNAPNTLRDQLVLPGQTYLYTIVGQTRGAQFAIVDSVDTDGDGLRDSLAPDSLVLAPSLTNPLATSVSEPNVSSVYVPASVQAGSQLAEAFFEEPDTFGYATGPFDVRFTGAAVDEGSFRAIFANEFEVAQVVRRGSGRIVFTRVTARDVVLAETGPGTADDVAVETLVLTTTNPNGVDIAGEAGPVTVVADTTFTTLEGLGFVLYRVGTDEPLLVSTVLDGEETTPSTFFARVRGPTFTGFPGFIVNVDDTEAGDFDRSRYQFEVDGDTIPNQVVPTVTWDNQASESNQAGGISAYGKYDITWADFAFGPGAPFELNLASPSETDADYDASLQARTVAATGRTDAAAAAAIAAATGLTVAEEDLVAVKVPFTVRNALYDRPVDLAMRARSDNTALLGAIGSQDTLSVTVPEDQWIPGDELYFIETVELDSIGESGGIVLDGSGRPIKVQREAATFAPAVISCLNFPRASCNPVGGPGSTLDWVSPLEGQNLAVFYTSPYQLESRLTYRTQRAITGNAAIAAGMDITAQMDSIHAVPNPYVMFSEYQIATPGQDDARLMFTHLPPRGVLRIFTVSGQFVQEISWEPAELVGNGDLYWNMRTREGNEVAGGLYVFTVQANNPATGETVKKIGKFAVIK